MREKLWTVALYGGRQCPYTVTVAFLAPRLERPVAMKTPWMPSFYIGYGPHIYIETYEVVSLSRENLTASAVYRGLRRSCELARHFDPKRLPS